MMFFGKRRGAAVQQITPVEAKERAAQGHVVLDVREQFEWTSAHVPGATHIPLGELPARLSELPSGTPIIIVCRSGSRSNHAARLLASAGIEVANLKGGLAAWKSAGLALEPTHGTLR